tara:strand:+ start:227 stop:661 length:435 start_codon:yes stop_codon:yes gene_type:complete
MTDIDFTDRWTSIHGVTRGMEVPGYSQLIGLYATWDSNPGSPVAKINLNEIPEQDRPFYGEGIETYPHAVWSEHTEHWWFARLTVTGRGAVKIPNSGGAYGIRVKIESENAKWFGHLTFAGGGWFRAEEVAEIKAALAGKEDSK